MKVSQFPRSAGPGVQSRSPCHRPPSGSLGRSRRFPECDLEWGKRCANAEEVEGRGGYSARTPEAEHRTRTPSGRTGLRLHGPIFHQLNPVHARAEEQIPEGVATKDTSRLLESVERDQHDKEDGGIGDDASQRAAGLGNSAARGVLAFNALEGASLSRLKSPLIAKPLSPQPPQADVLVGALSRLALSPIAKPFVPPPPHAWPPRRFPWPLLRFPGPYAPALLGASPNGLLRLSSLLRRAFDLPPPSWLPKPLLILAFRCRQLLASGVVRVRPVQLSPFRAFGALLRQRLELWPSARRRNRSECGISQGPRGAPKSVAVMLPRQGV